EVQLAFGPVPPLPSVTENEAGIDSLEAVTRQFSQAPLGVSSYPMSNAILWDQFVVLPSQRPQQRRHVIPPVLPSCSRSVVPVPNRATSSRSVESLAML